MAMAVGSVATAKHIIEHNSATSPSLMLEAGRQGWTCRLGDGLPKLII